MYAAVLFRFVLPANGLMALATRRADRPPPQSVAMLCDGAGGLGLVFVGDVLRQEPALVFGALIFSTIVDQVFSAFDNLASEHGVEKIKTIGDAYMAVAGLPEAREDHAAASPALAMQRTVAELDIQTDPPLRIRIGLRSGAVVAGVIGKARFAYDLWGDIVNTAAPMESHGLAGEIQVTDAIEEQIRASFDLQERGVIDVKGKGPARTWLLRGARESGGAEPGE